MPALAAVRWIRVGVGAAAVAALLRCVALGKARAAHALVVLQIEVLVDVAVAVVVGGVALLVPGLVDLVAHGPIALARRRSLGTAAGLAGRAGDALGHLVAVAI